MKVKQSQPNKHLVTCQQQLSCSVTLEKKGTLFWEDHFSGAATKKRGKIIGATEQLRQNEPRLLSAPLLKV